MGIRDVCWALLAGVVLSGCNNCEGWSVPDAGVSGVSEGWASRPEPRQPEEPTVDLVRFPAE